MAYDTTHAATRRGAGDSASQTRTLLTVSAAHLISHFHIMVLPVLLPLLKERLGVGYFELGLALTVFSVVTGLTQAPMGILVDRIGARAMLIAGLALAGVAFLCFGLFISYAWLLFAAVLAGLANCVYHPADYKLLSDAVSDERLGRAFSIHIFAGFLGGAIAPPVLLALTAVGGLKSALFACSLAAFATALALLLMREPTRSASRALPGARVRPRGASGVLNPAVLSLTIFFTLLAMANSALSSFSAVALIAANGISLIAANAALTLYLAGAAAGVLVGGAVADKTAAHGGVAAVGFGLGAMILLAIAALSLGPAVLMAAMGVAGFVFGIIQPSRDMLVRKAAPAGAVGRVFGIVSTGFNIGGIFGPMLFGWLMDHGAPRAIFFAAALFMALTALSGLVEERRRRAPVDSTQAA
jgi:MFS family permease